MRLLVSLLVSSAFWAPQLSARGIDGRTYQRLCGDADAVLVVRSRGTRLAVNGDNVVLINDDSHRTRGRKLRKKVAKQPRLGDEGMDVPQFASDSTPEAKSETADDLGLEAVVTDFDVIAVMKGDATLQKVSVSHYRYKAGASKLGNGPMLVSFIRSREERLLDDLSDETPLVIDNGEQTHYLLFLSQTASGLWTFETGQFDPELSVRKLALP